MGINGNALKWFKTYLSGRSQKVDIKGNLSEAMQLDISVIQGSILGPIIFLCYINDLYSATSLIYLRTIQLAFQKEKNLMN
jgi:hypothetical protein